MQVYQSTIQGNNGKTIMNVSLQGELHAWHKVEGSFQVPLRNQKWRPNSTVELTWDLQCQQLCTTIIIVVPVKSVVFAPCTVHRVQRAELLVANENTSFKATHR